MLSTSKEDAMDFTLSAKSLGRTVTVRPERREEVDFNGLFRFSEQGTIIGISGHETPKASRRLPWSSNSGLLTTIPFRSWSS